MPTTLPFFCGESASRASVIERTVAGEEMLCRQSQPMGMKSELAKETS